MFIFASIVYGQEENVQAQLVSAQEELTSWFNDAYPRASRTPNPRESGQWFHFILDAHSIWIWAV